MRVRTLAIDRCRRRREPRRRPTARALTSGGIVVNQEARRIERRRNRDAIGGTRQSKRVRPTFARTAILEAASSCEAAAATVTAVAAMAAMAAAI